MNKHIGWLAADFWSILTMAILLFLHQPVAQPVTHNFKALPAEADLLRVLDGQYQVFHHNKWQAATRSYSEELRQWLVIACNNPRQCAEPFGIKALQDEKLLIALPANNKQQAEKLLYQKCAIKGLCIDLEIVHDGNEVSIFQKKAKGVTH